MISKQKLKEFILQYKSKNTIRLAGLHYTAEMTLLVDFVNKLADGELNPQAQLTLEKLIEKDEQLLPADSVKDKHNKEETTRIFKLIRQEINHIIWPHVQQRWNELFNVLTQLWRDSHYVNRSQVLIDMFQETTSSKLLTHQIRAHAQQILAVTYLAVSMYGMTYTGYAFLFASKLNQSLGEIPNRFIQHKFKSQMMWSLGLALQIGFDLMTEAGGALVFSYVGATLMQAFVHRLILMSQRNTQISKFKTNRPATLQFINNALEDFGFYLGATLGTKFNQRLVSQPMLAKIPSQLEADTNIKSTVNELASACEPPQGSYTKTCDIQVKPYVSSDRNLQAMALCEFTINCKTDTLDNFASRQTTILIVPSSMRDCLKRLENCNGYPRIRLDDTQKCLDANHRKQEAYPEQRSITGSSHCNLPKGTYLDTCTKTGEPYLSSDNNLKHVPLCKFSFGCLDLNGVKHYINYIAQSILSQCFPTLENCNGQLYFRDDMQRLCVDSVKAQNPQGRRLVV